MKETQHTDKLDMQSPNIVSQNIEKIAELFPNCVTEGENGKVIDFDLLKQELNEDIVSGTKERYRLEWPGKKEAIVTANLPTIKTLRPVREDSVDFDTTENLYIEGDNLEVLKILQESYLGKIKMIYIDPPYNTGKDFVYKDNFKQNTEKYKEESGQVDEYNQRLFQNPETSGRYHSDWLSMMYPRLKLARNLLTDDGVILISIDDGEVSNLTKICDEIFGNETFMANFLWKSRQTPDSRSQTKISTDHEYVICYAKSASNFKFRGRDIDINQYSNPDNDSRGPWASKDLTVQATKDQRPNQFYDIVDPKTGIHYPPNPQRVWAKSKPVMDALIRENAILFPPSKKGRPREKKFLNQLQSNRTGFQTLLLNNQVGFTTTGTREFSKIFSERIFDFPKPTTLIATFIEQILEEGGIMLDFFAGSSSSAESLISYNALHPEKRSYIQIQIPETTAKNGQASRSGYKNICEIGKERIRRAAKKIKEETGAVIDYGFRVYRLDDSNMQDVYYTPQEYKQQDLELFKDNVKPDRTAEDLLTQVILDWGLPLSLKIDKADIEGKEVFKVAGNSLFACFDTGVDEAFAKAIAKDQPLRIVFKDASFKDDTAKENVKQLLKQLSPETEMRVI